MELFFWGGGVEPEGCIDPPPPQSSKPAHPSRTHIPFDSEIVPSAWGQVRWSSGTRDCPGSGISSEATLQELSGLRVGLGVNTRAKQQLGFRHMVTKSLPCTFGPTEGQNERWREANGTAKGKHPNTEALCQPPPPPSPLAQPPQKGGHRHLPQKSMAPKKTLLCCNTNVVVVERSGLRPNPNLALLRILWGLFKAGLSFWLRTAPRDHQPPTANRRQLPTANRKPPPTAHRQLRIKRRASP